jgi:acyl-CoA thioesterase
MPGFVDTTTVTPAGPDNWTARIPGEWGQGRAVFGGVITGVALRALGGLVSAERPLRSVLVDFVGPAAAGEIRVEARVLRSGRSLTQCEARVLQGDAVVAVLLAAYGGPRRTGITWPAPVRGAVPSPDGLPGFPYMPGVTPAFTQHFDYRWATHRLPFSGSDRPEIQGFVRPTGGREAVDAAMLLALIDAWPAPVLSMAQGLAPASTVTWMVDVVGPLDPAAEDDRFWWFEGAATAAGDGYGDVHGRIFDPDGRLIATSKQLVAEFSKPV